MRKSLFILLLIFIGTFSLLAQENSFYSNDTQTSEENKNINHLFLGSGIGVNNHCGIIGALIEYSPIKKLSIIGGLGIGGWGYKSSLGIRYYNREFPKKLFYGLTFTSASGLQGFETDLETTRSESESVELNLNRVNNLALSIGYQWMVFRNGRLNFEIGYSVPFQQKAYEVVTPSIVLTENSKTFMQVMTPGGLIIGLAFTIGL